MDHGTGAHASCFIANGVRSCAAVERIDCESMDVHIRRPAATRSFFAVSRLGAWAGAAECSVRHYAMHARLEWRSCCLIHRRALSLACLSIFFLIGSKVMDSWPK